MSDTFFWSVTCDKYAEPVSRAFNEQMQTAELIWIAWIDLQRNSKDRTRPDSFPVSEEFEFKVAFLIDGLDEVCTLQHRDMQNTKAFMCHCHF